MNITPARFFQYCKIKWSHRLRRCIISNLNYIISTTAYKIRFVLSASKSYSDSEVSENYSGFFGGFLGDFALTEAFHLEPAIIYGNAENLNILFIPVLAKYYLGESGFNLIAGPQESMILDDMDPAFKRLGWDLTFGAGYDVTERIFLEQDIL